MKYYFKFMELRFKQNQVSPQRTNPVPMTDAATQHCA